MFRIFFFNIARVFFIIPYRPSARSTSDSEPACTFRASSFSRSLSPRIRTPPPLHILSKSPFFPFSRSLPGRSLSRLMLPLLVSVYLLFVRGITWFYTTRVHPSPLPPFFPAAFRGEKWRARQPSSPLFFPSLGRRVPHSLSLSSLLSTLALAFKLD